VGDGIGPYVIWWMGTRRLVVESDPNRRPDVPRSERWSTWPVGAEEHYLLVDAAQAPDFVHRPGVVVVKTRRGAVLLRKTA
jgi:hypothetical protein